MKRLEGLVACLPLAALACAGSAAAGDFDGSRTLVCVPQEAVECTLASDCERASPDGLGIPNFIEVDFDKKTLSDDTGESDQKTAIQNLQKVDGKTILQGAQTGRGWSIVIDQQNGRMSATTSGVDDSGDRYAFILFGVCKLD